MVNTLLIVNPFKFRPENMDDPEVKDIDWEDNWASNGMAWVSQQWPLRPMCNDEKHWSSRISNYLHTDCPCCLTWRGLILGFLFGSAFVVILQSLGGKRSRR